MIEVKALTVRRSGRTILNELDVTFGAGRLTAVVGPNGAGKSTLLRALGGIGNNTTGHIQYDGRAIQSLDHTKLAQRVAYLPQDHHVSWPMQVRRVVELGRMPYASALARLTDGAQTQVSNAMHAMSIAHLSDRAATTLSGGELARVLVARLLAQDTPVLLADEPAAGLDPAHALALFEHFQRLAEDGRTVIVAMHDLSFALRFCDDALLLKQGQRVAFGAARDVLTRENIAAAYGVTASIGEVDGVPVVLPLHGATS